MPTLATRHPPRHSLGKDIRTGLLYAAGLSILATIIIGVEGATTVAGIQNVTGWDSLSAEFPLIIASYFLGGTLAGFALWVLRPLRRNVLGWALTGFVVGTLAYGAIGLTGVFGYYSGANFLDLSSAKEGWDLLPTFSPALGLLVGVPAGIYYWYKRKSR